MHRLEVLAILTILAVPACGPSPQVSVRAPASDPAPNRTTVAPAVRLARGLEHLAASRYPQAEADLRAALESPETHDAAAFGLGRLELVTGRYAEAVQTAAGLGDASAPLRGQAWFVRGEALRRQGQLDEALALLAPLAGEREARRARLLLGEILVELGRREEAEPVLLGLIEDFNADRIGPDDGEGLAVIGRAAHLLRSPHDANDAFNQAERAQHPDLQTLLWRAELFLEKYDPGHAEEVLRDVLRQAPNHPEALVWMAQVKLAQTYDFDEAERLAREALRHNPRLAGAHFVLAGIALRDMELQLADTRIAEGLKSNPRDLDLLSLQATVRFLADDRPGFERAKQHVLQLSPGYSRFFGIVGEYAEWEHRYDEIVEMMREAVIIDPQDAQARAALGLNLIRDGEDYEGKAELKRAFAADPFNVRVYNTLGLYEKVIPQHYVTVRHDPFIIRYHRDEQELLERYVPEWLGRAWESMVKGYGFEPSSPVGIELYAERQNFSIRTSGLPNTGIQGVCFGKTLAAISPMNESFNLGMTLWHELAHVFHIQLSKNHVPRWFTEGLAEYETLSARAEWSREHDPDLYVALESGRLPRVAAMNRAFTRAEDMRDMATAYYASTQILTMLEERVGPAPLSRMLKLWGEGRRTPEVVKTALGTTPEDLDREFREYLNERLSRYSGQFVPLRRAPELARAREQAKKSPRDPQKQVELALAAAGEGDVKEARTALQRALGANPQYPDALWLAAKLASKTGASRAAFFPREGQRSKSVQRAAPEPRGKAASRALLQELVALGHDGYAVQMGLAEAALAQRDLPGASLHLTAAHQFDPTMSEPLTLLLQLARQSGDAEEELGLLRKLARLEQHDPAVFRRLLELLSERDLLEEALQVAQAAIFTDVNGLRTHQLYGDVLARSGRPKDAVFELESAVLCPGRPQALADAHAQLAELYLKVGRRRDARTQAQRGRELDPSNPRLKALRL